MVIVRIARSRFFSISLPLLLGLLSMPFLTGCGDRQKFVPVHGIVTLDQKPLAGANVVFEPIAHSPQNRRLSLSHPAFAVTDEQGKFKLYNPIEKKEGVIVGRHRVRVLASEKRTYTESQKKQARQRLVKRDQRDEVPTRDISDQDVLDYLEESSPLRAKERLPSRYNSRSTLEIEITANDSKEHVIELLSE